MAAKLPDTAGCSLPLVPRDILDGADRLWWLGLGGEQGSLLTTESCRGTTDWPQDRVGATMLTPKELTACGDPHAVESHLCYVSRGHREEKIGRQSDR